MKRLSEATRALSGWIAAFLVVTSIGCTTELEPGSAGVPTPGDAFAAFFAGAGDLSAQRLAAGDEVVLPGGATLALPRNGPGGIDFGIVNGGLTQEAGDAFRDEFPDVALSGAVMQITARAHGATPDYMILRLPAEDPVSRVFVAGYIDDDTGELAWEPVDTRFDAATGMATALVGWDQLGPVELAAEPTQKQARTMSDAGPVVYTGHVAIGVGGQPFDGEFAIIPQAPTGPVTVGLHEPPPSEGGGMTASAQVGLRLSRITHPPLDALAVNSGFGPRRRPVAGASTNHRGVDYAAQVGTNVYAAGDGVVITSRCARANPTCGPRANGEITAGYIVEVDHGNGETTRYLHLTNPALVQPGDRVTAGQVIAQSGNTGGVGPHLHFEVRKNGVAVDPQRFFGGPLTATMAMAIDNHVQAGSQLEIPLTRGEITPETLEQYIGVVDLSGLSLGVHKLQFVLVQPRRRLAVLAEVPLIVAQGVLTGTEISIDAVTTPISEAGAFDRKNNRKEFTFTLSAAENGTIEGAGHVTYSLGYESFRPNSGCPDTTSFASVEWDVSLSGFYSRLEDGSISVTFFSTPSAGPRYLFTQNSPGCPEKTFTQELSGESSPSLSATLVDGYYSFRTDVPLSTGQTGEYSHTLSMYWLE